LVVAQHSEAKDVYERIALETFVEINFATNRGNPDAVAVMRDARNDARKQSPISRDFRFSSFGFRIFIRDWPET
jgi:hypothetical protein